MKELEKTKIQPAGKKSVKMKCWETFQCNETACPAYKSGDPNCWLFSGTHCHKNIQGKFIEKMEMCSDCVVYSANMDYHAMHQTCNIINKQFKEFGKLVKERDRELENTGLELALSISEVLEALKKISAGDPTVRIPETSTIELISRLKQMINVTAENIGEIVDQSHEFAMGLAEHFDVLHKVTEGDLNARISGSSPVELIEALKEVSNKMIASVDKEITERKKFEVALQESEEKFRTISTSARDAIIMIDDKGTVSFWNKAAETIFGYSALEIAEEKIHSFLVPLRYRETSEKGLHEFGLTGQGPVIGKTLEYTALRKDGIELPVSLSVSAVKVKDNWNAIGIVRDISERKKTEAALRESEKRYRDLFENTTDLIQIIAPDGRFLFVNAAWMVSLGYFEEDILRLTIWDIIHPDNLLHCRESFQQVLSGRNMQNIEVTFVTKTGKFILVEGNINCFFRNSEPEYIRCIFHDISDRKRMEEDLRTMSLRDELTGLYNRRGFITLAEQQLKIADRMKRGLSLLFADLDGMKFINDTFGHQEGDRALIDTTNILKDTFRGSDILARVGGDEFVVLALETNDTYCDLLADRLKANFDAFNKKGGRDYTLTLSIGIAHYDPENPCSMDDLLKRADNLMYNMKKKKRRE
jgi:diguanylate cyclase (GGDEF)-like protein/PAS domain S-box-containing protein